MAIPSTPSHPLRRGPVRRVSRGKRVVRWCMVFIVVAVTIDAVVGDRGLLAMMRARDQYDAAAQALERQKAENARLRDQVDRLKSDPAAIEELAREELSLMQPGEKLFIIKDLKPRADARK